MTHGMTHMCIHVAEDCRGKKMGIIGYGSIGQACARIAHAYGMLVSAVCRSGSAPPGTEVPGLQVCFS